MPYDNINLVYNKKYTLYNIYIIYVCIWYLWTMWTLEHQVASFDFENQSTTIDE